MYTKSQQLACHDDRVSNRAIAFIYYLSDEIFELSDGGTLDLYENENGIPNKIKHKLIPTANTFVIFKVSPDSFHKVDEILTDKKRYSLTGWFHADSIKHPIGLSLSDKKCFRFIEPVLIKIIDETIGDGGITDKMISKKLQFEEINLNPILLKENNIKQMTDVIMNNCIIEINQFLTSEIYVNIKQVLKDTEFFVYSDPMILQQKIFKSKQRQSLINSIQKCKIGQFSNLQTYIESLCMLKIKSLKYADVYKISHRSFAMAVDYRIKCSIELHFYLFFVEKEWDEGQGGTIHQLNNEESLWNIIPKDNTAVIVLIDNAETYDILKYTNVSSLKSSKYQMLKLIQEVDEECEGDDED